MKQARAGLQEEIRGSYEHAPMKKTTPPPHGNERLVGGADADTWRIAFQFHETLQNFFLRKVAASRMACCLFSSPPSQRFRVNCRLNLSETAMRVCRRGSIAKKPSECQQATNQNQEYPCKEPLPLARSRFSRFDHLRSTIGYPLNFVATSVALWPPKPKELLTMASTFIPRAVFGTQSRSHSGSGFS